MQMENSNKGENSYLKSLPTSATEYTSNGKEQTDRQVRPLPDIPSELTIPFKMAQQDLLDLFEDIAGAK